MLIRAKDLASLRIDARDGADHRVADIFLADDRLRATYVVAEFDGWFDDRQTLVPFERFGAPDVGAGVWPVALRQDEIAEAPPPRDRGTAPEPPQPRAALLGPLGGVLTPRMAPEEAEDAAVGAKSDPENLVSGGGQPRSVSEMHGMAVHAEDGPVGHLLDVILEAETGALAHVVVETGDPLPENQYVVPADFVAGIDWDAPELRLACTGERVRRSPELHQKEGLDRNWINGVLAYYGLQS